MEWKVPLADLSFGPEEKEAVNRVLDSKWVSMGPETELFEGEFAHYLGARHCVAVSSGTAALHLALLALGVKPGDEVILPSLTFVATANTVLSVGAVPVFADVTSLQDWNISVERIKEKITPVTKAIIAVHYAGFPCRMDLIGELANAEGIVVIEDAAHAPGSVLQGTKIGTWGDVGCFSFFSNKNLTTAEGGMAVTDNDETAKRLRLLRSHGMTAITWDRHRGHCFSYDVVATGYNYRIDEIRAALGRVQLRKLDENNQKRREKAGLVRTLLKAEPRVSCPFPDEMLASSSCHIFPVLLSEASWRDNFMTHMRDAGVQTSIHYPPVHRFTAFKSLLSAHDNRLSLTEDIASREVTLPLFPDLSNQQIEMVVTELMKGSHNNTPRSPTERAVRAASEIVPLRGA